MKKLILSLIALLAMSNARADEGMWTIYNLPPQVQADEFAETQTAQRHSRMRNRPSHPQTVRCPSWQICIGYCHIGLSGSVPYWSRNHTDNASRGRCHRHHSCADSHRQE